MINSTQPARQQTLFIHYALWRIALSVVSRNVSFYCDGRYAGGGLYQGKGRWSRITFRSHYTRLRRKELSHVALLLEEAEMLARQI